jgi:putative hemolysin
VLGELLPKRIGLNHPEAIAKAVAMPMKIVSIITAPFIWLLTFNRVLAKRIANTTFSRR